MQTGHLPLLRCTEEKLRKNEWINKDRINYPLSYIYGYYTHKEMFLNVENWTQKELLRA